MITFGIILVLSIIIIAIGLYEMKKYVDKPTEEISFRDSMNLTDLPVITMENNNNKINFLLDTGSDESYINETILSNYDYNSTDYESSVVGMEGNVIKCDIVIMTINYKNLSFTEEFRTAPLNNAFQQIKQSSGVTIHGILGSKFFTKYKYILDFNELNAKIK